MNKETIKEIIKQMVKAHDEYVNKMGWLWTELNKEMNAVPCRCGGKKHEASKVCRKCFSKGTRKNLSRLPSLKENGVKNK